tara:strand:+ start:792 stop:1070 length:279 start_codon:yes stop_codon:yes gene_type:complete
MNSTHAYLNPQLNKSIKNSKRLDFLADYLIFPEAFDIDMVAPSEYGNGECHICKIGHEPFCVEINFKAENRLYMMHVRGRVVEELLRLKGLS